MNPEQYPIGVTYGLKPSEKKWKPVLPAWEWSGLSIERFVKYCELKECKS